MINFDVKEGWLGNLEEKRTQGGKAVMTGSIAIVRNKDEQSGKWIYDYINVVAYEEIAEQMRDYSNNDKVLLCGKWRHDKSTDQQGINRYYDKLVISSIGLIKKSQQTQEIRESDNAQYMNNITVNQQPNYEYMNTPDDYVSQNSRATQSSYSPFNESPALRINTDDLPF